MKPLTKKQRREIYLKAALFFFNKKIPGNQCGFCDLGNDLRDFPEYLLFKPNPGEAATTYGYWFAFYSRENGVTKSTQSDRVNALLFCAEMCNP